jgi:hypothetical protein
LIIKGIDIAGKSERMLWKDVKTATKMRDIIIFLAIIIAIDMSPIIAT